MKNKILYTVLALGATYIFLWEFYGLCFLLNIGSSKSSGDFGQWWLDLNKHAWFLVLGIIVSILSIKIFLKNKEKFKRKYKEFLESFFRTDD